jgi:hypothetical protein
VHTRSAGRDAGYNCLVPADGWRGGEAIVPSASPHAPARHGIQAGQRWARHSVAGTLPRAPKSSIDRTVHCVGTGSFQRLLARLTLGRWIIRLGVLAGFETLATEGEMDTLSFFAIGCLIMALAAVFIGAVVGSPQLILAGLVIVMVSGITIFIVIAIRTRLGR